MLEGSNQLVGIVTWKSDFSKPKHPGIYTNVGWTSYEKSEIGRIGISIKESEIRTCKLYQNLY